MIQPLILLAALWFVFAAAGQEPVSVAPEPGLVAMTAKTIEAGSKEPWRYLLFLPKRYFESGAEPLPLLLFLHGSSGRGKDFDVVKRYGPPSRLKNETDFPMAMLAPQLPGGGWDPGSVLALLDEVLASYRIDPDRIYLTGVSLGGQGSWSVAARAPERFAAFAPVCGYGDLRNAPQFAKLPVWAFHGALDDIIPLAPHQALIEAVNAAGGSAKLTIYETGDHGNIIVPVYGREGGGRLYTWLLTHRRGQPVVPLPAAERLERLPGPGTPAAPPTPSPSTSTPQPGEFWDRLFQLLDGEAKPAGAASSEGPHAGGAIGPPAP